MDFDLSHLRRDERQLATKYLMALGFSQYRKLTSSNVVNVDSLAQILSGATKDAPAAGKRFSSNLSTRSQKVERKSRGDALQKYPFADSLGGVAETLRSPPSQVCFSSIGLGARRRMAQKVFRDLKDGVHGMRVSSIYEGLALLGIQISTRHDKLFSPLDATRGGAIGESAWQSLVQKFVEYELEANSGRHSRDCFMECDNSNVNEQGDQTDEEVLLYDSPPELSPSKNEKDKACSYDEKRRASSGLIHAKSTILKKDLAQAKNQNRPPPPTGMAKQPMKGNIKPAKSKIKDQVDADKLHHNRTKQERKEAALATLSKGRVDLSEKSVSIGSMLTYPYNIRRDLLVGQESSTSEEPSSGVSSVESSPGAEGVLQFDSSSVDLDSLILGYEKTKKTTRREAKAKASKRLANLSSGLASLGIADNFLGGALGKQILQRDGDKSKNISTTSSPKDVMVSSLDSPQGTKGWVAKSGGWVADFGPVTVDGINASSAAPFAELSSGSSGEASTSSMTMDIKQNVSLSSQKNSLLFSSK